MQEYPKYPQGELMHRIEFEIMPALQQETAVQAEALYVVMISLPSISRSGR